MTATRNIEQFQGLEKFTGELANKCLVTVCQCYPVTSIVIENVHKKISKQ